MYLQSFFVLTLCASAAFCDVRTGKISNAFALAGICTGLCLSLSGTVPAAAGDAVLPAPPASLASLAPGTHILSLTGLPGSILGAGIPLLFGFPLFHIRALGAGDVKLLMAVGSIIGSNAILPFLMACIVCGAAIALPILIAGRDRKARFHFSIPILMAAMLYAGGLIH